MSFPFDPQSIALEGVSSSTVTPRHAVLLAAGRGLRLRPLTDHTPKPLLPVNGRAALDWILDATRRAGVTHACLVTGHLEQQIRQFAGDGADWGLQVEYVHQPDLLGTAHALRCVIEQLPGFLPPDQPFILSATDYALPEHYLIRLVDHHLVHQAEITLSLKKIPQAELARRSCVLLAEGWRVERIVEKPSPSQTLSPYAASLTLILPSQAVGYLDRLAPTGRGELEWADLVNVMIADGFTAQGCLLPAPPEFEFS